MRKFVAATLFTLFGAVAVVAAQPASAAPVHPAFCSPQHKCPTP